MGADRKGNDLKRNNFLDLTPFSNKGQNSKQMKALT